MDDEKKKEFRERINDYRQKRDKSWERYFTPTNKHYKMIRRRFSWMKQFLVGPRILDIGCGPGIICQLASEKKGVTDVHGLDLQDDALTAAQLNVKSDRVRFHCGFAEELPFEDGYFNTAVMGEVLEHVYDEKKAVREAYRILQHRGVIIVTVPNDRRLSFCHIRIFSEKALARLLTPFFNIEEVLHMNQHIACMGRRK